jgi:plastocyanin
VSARGITVGAAVAALMVGCGSKAHGGSLAKTLPTAEPNDTDIAVTIRPEAATVGSFGPSSLTIKTGERVVWNNWSQNTHSVTFDDGAIGTSPDLAGGGTWSARFPTAGTFAYHCHFHSGMTGTVVVN